MAQQGRALHAEPLGRVLTSFLELYFPQARCMRGSWMQGGSCHPTRLSCRSGAALHRQRLQCTCSARRMHCAVPLSCSFQHCFLASCERALASFAIS